MRRAILHIGTEKTGTSSLQLFLMENRALLAKHGFHYARFPGHINHTKLTAYAAADGVKDDLRIDIGVTAPEHVEPFRRRLEAEAVAELEDVGDKVVIFSNEHCSSRLTSAEEIGRLKSFLDRFFDEVRVTVYLRRQDQIAVSLYSTLLKFGGHRWEILPDPKVRADYWNYDLLLENWAAAFGRNKVVPRIFDREVLVGRSVVNDFISRWKLGRGYKSVSDTNESLQPMAQEVLRRMNIAFPGYVDGDLNRMRGALGARIGALYPGSGARPSRDEAETFLAAFAEHNEAVRQKWFPERRTLFSDDFSNYPETGDRREFSFDEALEVMVELWRATQAKEIHLRYDLAVKDGEIAQLKGDLAAARLAYSVANRIDPDRPKARERLAELEAADAGEAPSPERIAELAERWAEEERAEIRAVERQTMPAAGLLRRIVGSWIR